MERVELLLSDNFLSIRETNLHFKFYPNNFILLLSFLIFKTRGLVLKRVN